MDNTSGLSHRSRATLASLRKFGFQTTKQAKPPESGKTPIDASLAENWTIRPELLSIFQDIFQTKLRDQARTVRPHPIILPRSSARNTNTVPVDGFDFHFSVRADVHPVAAPIRDLHDAFNPDVLLESLTETFDTSPYPIRALVLTNPGNPLGHCYSPETLRRCARFCHDRGMHLICDEVFALSYFGGADSKATPFQSIVSSDLSAIGCHLSRVHVVWSMSKDFGCSGLRIGCVISQANPELILGLRVPTSTEVSSLSTLCSMALLASGDLPKLIELNQKRLSLSYRAVIATLESHGVEYIPATAGLCVFARLAPDAKTLDDEISFQRHLRDSGLLVSPDRERTMESTLKILGASLQEALSQLTGPLNKERLATLHDHSEGRLVDANLDEIAAHTIDLLHQVEQLLEPSSLVLADHFLGYLNTKCLCAAVEFHIPDILVEGPKSVLQLARLSGARADRLGQVLRLLRNNGIFQYNAENATYSNNPTSDMLRSDHWTQWQHWVDLYGNEFYDMARGIPASLKQGTTRTPAQINFNTDQNMFDYFTDQGWLPRLHRTLGSGATAQAPGILADYPWEEFGDGPFLDIGGGEGALIALILRRHTLIKAALLDTPRVIEHARTLFLSMDGNRLSRYGDLTMMVSADGQERTEAEWRALAGRTGWEIRTIRKLRGAWPSDETSYINYIKPLILARELEIPHVLSVIDTKDEWFYRIHPERMVPSLKDQDPETKAEVIVFESTACLQYLADRFDDGTWTGRNAAERGSVLSWTAYQTAALGLHANCLRQWDILEKGLALDGQEYIALKDRPSIADLSYFPFSMPWMVRFLGVDIKDWPSIERWSQRMLARPAVQAVMEMGPKIGH
ncbi:O-methyltransferase gliM [Aspergillus lucknowensis]|uniref:GST C-terminal domain-containing protein n=1 Tax=Aspergillus lucknowensis TaxID=176173 RepID=A0ABR4LYK1_9EURO